MTGRAAHVIMRMNMRSTTTCGVGGSHPLRRRSTREEVRGNALSEAMQAVTSCAHDRMSPVEQYLWCGRNRAVSVGGARAAGGGGPRCGARWR